MLSNNLSIIYNPSHYTISRFTIKEKHKFISKEECDNFIKNNKMNDKHSYLCEICNYWHIGNKKRLKRINIYDKGTI